MKRIRVCLLVVLLIMTTGCVSSVNTELTEKSFQSASLNRSTQDRRIGLQFRKLSNLFIQYRFRQWTNLTEKEQYHIENIEWSLINYCSDFVDKGFSGDSKISGSQISRIMDRMEYVASRIQQIIDSGKKENEKVIALGMWSMHLGAAVASEKIDKIDTLLESYTVSIGSEKTGSYADPVISRQIGLNFSKASDFMLAYHYKNWDQLTENQKSKLQNIELTLLNYNSNFGGLGIKVKEQETESLMKNVLAQTEEYVQSVAEISGESIGYYEKIVQLSEKILLLGAALTGEDISLIKKILAAKATDESLKLGREIGLKFRDISFLLLQYRYKNWDGLGKKRQYHLENLEFTLTNFNSDFAVFGIQINDKTLIQRIHFRIDMFKREMSKDHISFERIFSQGSAAMKLAAAILTRENHLIDRIVASTTVHPTVTIDNSTVKLSRDIALKMRIIANNLLKQSIVHWNFFTDKERRVLRNIQWTLMNFTSNFSVLGIKLNSTQGAELLQIISEKLDRNIHEICSLNVENPIDRKNLFQLGMNSLKTGAVLTNEDISAIKNMAR